MISTTLETGLRRDTCRSHVDENRSHELHKRIDSAWAKVSGEGVPLAFGVTRFSREFIKKPIERGAQSVEIDADSRGLCKK